MGKPYPSDEWIRELQRVCNQDLEFREACLDFSGKFIFQVEAEPGKLDRTTYLFFWADRGEAKEAMALSSVEERPDVEYVITGKYTAWKEIVSARLEPLRALMTRKVKLTKGSQLKILKQVKFALRMMNNCTRIDTEFQDETA